MGVLYGCNCLSFMDLKCRYKGLKTEFWKGIFNFWPFSVEIKLMSARISLKLLPYQPTMCYCSDIQDKSEPDLTTQPETSEKISPDPTWRSGKYRLQSSQ